MMSIMDGNPIERTLKTEIHRQQDLGVRSLPKGYLVKDWEEVQYLWTKSSNTISYEINKWMPQLIISIHNYTYSVWKLRNDILHNDKVKSKKAIKRICLQERITELYRRG